MQHYIKQTVLKPVSVDSEIVDETDIASIEEKTDELQIDSVQTEHAQTSEEEKSPEDEQNGDSQEIDTNTEQSKEETTTVCISQKKTLDRLLQSSLTLHKIQC